jgi:uncharacterized membrane protein
MKKNRNIFLVVVGVLAMLFWSTLFVSCISADTAYRIGYDLGSSLSYEGNSNVGQNSIDNHSTTK